MKLNFTKMHGCGNDYVYVNCMDKDILGPEEISRKISQRRYSVGSDGLILICASDKADAKMRIFNADGSEGKMCGNGIRCVGKYIYDRKIVDSKNMKIDTLSGIKYVDLLESKGKKSILKVDMGSPVFSPEKIPVRLGGKRVIDEEVIISGEKYNINCVSMGNPHCVCFFDDLNGIDIENKGKNISESDLFPEGVNVEFVKVLDKRSISMRVWERGSSETYACGTGACAAVVASIENGIFNKNEDIKVLLKGGELVINYVGNHVYMTGPAEEVFEGEIDI